MNSKFVLLALAAVQVSCSLEWCRPHIRNYRKFDKHGQSDSYEDSHQTSSSGLLRSPHSDDHKPVYEDQNDVPSEEHYRNDERLYNDEAGNRLHRRPRNDCEIFVNPIRPRNDCEIFVNPIRLPYGEPADNHGGTEQGDYEVYNDEAGDRLHRRSRNDDCEIFMNPIRPPYGEPADNHGSTEQGDYEVSANQQSIEESSHQDIERRSHSELISEEGDLSTSSRLRSSLSKQLTDRDVQASIANSAMNGLIKAAALRERNIPAPVPIRSATQSSLLPDALPIYQPGLGPSPQLPSRNIPPPNFCIRHRLVPVLVRVVDECITNVPVVRKTVRHQVETVTHHVPVVQKTVTEQHEKIVRHVPVAGKTLRNVVETRVRHIPVIRSRTRTVVEPYTVHVPVTVRFTRPVEESITKTVPFQEVRTRPIVTHKTRFVPILEKRLRPVVEERVINVPVKKKYLRTIVEQRVTPGVGTCQPCIFPAQLIGLPWTPIPAGDIPKILLSPYSDLSKSQNGTPNPQLSTAVTSSRNTLLSTGPFAALHGDLPAVPGGQPFHEIACSPQIIPC